VATQKVDESSTALVAAGSLIMKDCGGRGEERPLWAAQKTGGVPSMVVEAGVSPWMR
jgi:hypothetical protein